MYVCIVQSFNYDTRYHLLLYISIYHAVESSTLFFQATHVDDVVRPKESESHEMMFFFLGKILTGLRAIASHWIRLTELHYML